MGFKQTETMDPRFPALTEEGLQAILEKCGGDRERARAAAEEWLTRRERNIALAQEDPLCYGYEPANWERVRRVCAQNDEVLLSGANREGKTEVAAKMAVEDMVNFPNRKWAFFHSSAQSSIAQQQPRVWSFLPPQWRSIGKIRGDKVTNVSYTVKNGFSDNTFVLPNGSQGWFFNYCQDVKLFEGYELSGAWFDELVPLPFIESMRFRLGNERMLVLLTFTPITGYTPVVKDFIAGAEVVESQRAALLSEDVVHVKGCPAGHMPTVMQCRAERRAAVFFHIFENPFSPSKKVAAKLEGANTEKVKIRAYGWADKMVQGAFAKYGKEHKMTRERFEELAKGAGTRYVACDPGGTKNWFLKWYFVTPMGWTVVYREWPDFQNFGEWALPSDKIDWRAGPAQKAEAGAGIREYKKRILEAEGWVWDDAAGAWDGSMAEVIETRVIDPRMGGMFIQDEGDGTSIVELLGEEQVDSQGRVVGPSMYFEAAPASRVEETVQMINERMDWDDREPLSVLNCPKWYVLEDCLQSDLAYREWTGAGSEKCALKDIIDPDRYFVKADLGYVDPSALETKGGGSY